MIQSVAGTTVTAPSGGPAEFGSSGRSRQTPAAPAHPSLRPAGGSGARSAVRRRPTRSTSRVPRRGSSGVWQLAPQPDSGAVVVREFAGGLAPRRVRPPRRPRQPRLARASAVRLTSRGRVVVCLLLLVLLVAAFSMGRSSRADSPGSTPAARGSVVVQPGQTLWQIAEQVAPQADPRATVATIVRLNPGTAGGEVRPGQTLRIPSR